jgi:iron complex outermembrane recepter protein
VQSSFFGAGVGRPIIRGQQGARVQVLSGGIASLDASTTSVDHAVAIEPFLADQIEVLKGPATLLYGSGAIGGAVNVVDGRIPTAPAEAGIRGRAELGFGTVADERSGMARMDGGSGRWAWHVDGFRRDRGDYEIPGFARSSHEEDEHAHEDNPFGLLPNSAVDTRGGAVGGSYIGERGYIGLSLSRFETLYGVPGHAHHEEHGDEARNSLKAAGLRASLLDEEEEEEEEGAIRIDLAQTRQDLRAGLEQPFGGFDRLELRLAANNYRHVELEGDEIGTRFDNDAVEGRLELVQSASGAWRNAYGLQFGRRDFRADGEEAFVPPSLTRDLGLFALGEYDRPAYKLELGGRADRIEVEAVGAGERSLSSFSASAGALWRASEALHFSLGLDRAQRAPGAEELFSDGPHAATRSYEVGDAGLGRETANQLELAAHIHRGPLEAKFATFANRFDDYIYLADTGEELEELPVRAWTQADARFRGLEAEASLELADNASGRWTLRLSGDRVDGKLDEGGNLPRIAPSRSGLGFAWTRGGWRAGVEAQRYGRQDKVAEFETPSEGFTLFNAQVAFHWDVGDLGWEVFFRGRNLTDREARLHTSVLKDEAPLPGRDLQLGVRAFF